MKKILRTLKEKIINSALRSSVSDDLKSDGCTRFCLDYKLLNKQGKAGIYPMRKVDKVKNCMARENVFTKLDTFHGY